MTDTCENCNTTHEVADYALNDGIMTLCEDCWVIKYERGKEEGTQGGFFVNGEPVFTPQVRIDTDGVAFSEGELRADRINWGGIRIYQDSIGRNMEIQYATLDEEAIVLPQTEE